MRSTDGRVSTRKEQTDDLLRPRSQTAEGRSAILRELSLAPHTRRSHEDEVDDVLVDPIAYMERSDGRTAAAEAAELLAIARGGGDPGDIDIDAELREARRGR